MREKVIVLSPVNSRLDHIRPALQRLSKIEKKDIELKLIPLQKNLENRLQIFCDFLRKQESFEKLPGNHTVEVSFAHTEFKLSEDWFSNWNILLHSLYLGFSNDKNFKTIVILLTEATPIGIILASSIASLSIPRIRLIEFPVGYDLNSQGSNFDPSRQIMEQMIEFRTWSDEGIRNPILELASKPEVLKVLDVILLLSENEVRSSKKRDLRNISLFKIKVSVIKNKLNDIEHNENKSKKTTSQALSNRLKILRKNRLIEKIEGEASYFVTETGLIVSGLLKNANE